MATFVDLILKGTKLDEAVKQQLADRVMHVVENCDKSAVLESARLDEAEYIKPNKRQFTVNYTGDQKYHEACAAIHEFNFKNMGVLHPEFFNQQTMYHEHLAYAEIAKGPDGSDKEYKKHKKLAAQTDFWHKSRKEDGAAVMESARNGYSDEETPVADHPVKHFETWKGKSIYHDRISGKFLIPTKDGLKSSYDIGNAREIAINEGLDEANMIPSKREAVVAFATQHYNKTHGTNFPKHDVHAHLYGGEAPEFADHVEKHANPEAADHLEKNFGLKKNSFMEGEDPCWVGYEMIGTKTKDGDEVPNCVKEQEDAPDNAIPPLSKEAVKKLLTTYQKRNLPAEYNIDEFLPKSPEGAARASATAGEDVPPVAHPAGPSPQDAYKNWFTNQGV